MYIFSRASLKDDLSDSTSVASADGSNKSDSPKEEKDEEKDSEPEPEETPEAESKEKPLEKHHFIAAVAATKGIDKTKEKPYILHGPLLDVDGNAVLSPGTGMKAIEEKVLAGPPGTPPEDSPDVEKDQYAKNLANYKAMEAAYLESMQNRKGDGKVVQPY